MNDDRQLRWPPTIQQVLWTVGFVAALAVAIIIVLGYAREWEWTGLVKDKAYTKRTLWDWLQLLIIPAVLAGVGLWFNRQQREQELQTADSRAQDEALHAYLDQMSDMLIPNKDQTPLSDEHPPDRLKTVARAQTLTVLPRLDGGRKARVVLFLYESGLIAQGHLVLLDEETGLVARDRLVLALSGADLTGSALTLANLRGANLGGANLRGANLSEADLRGTNLSGTNLIGANLDSAILTEANLRGANLRGASLIGANLIEANLDRGDVGALGETDLSGADLTAADLWATDLTEANLSGANLKEAYLMGANLSLANLSGANLMEANLSPLDDSTFLKPDHPIEADLIGANLIEANLSGADLSGAISWTVEQLAQAKSLKGATMPDKQILKGPQSPKGPTFNEWRQSWERAAKENSGP